MNHILIGVGLLVVSGLTHVAEAYHFLLWMGWGSPDTLGHYLALASAVSGIMFIARGIRNYVNSS